MPIFGLDVSHHQGPDLDFQAFRASGIDFVILKATEGSTFVDSQFARNLARAQAAGLLVAAYHYVRASAAAVTQVAHVRKIVPSGIPVIPDVETNSGTVSLTREFVTLLQQHYRVPLLYLPRWYWQQIGSPDLRGLPPLWSSRYPDNVIDSLPGEWADVPQHYWNGYGNLPVTMLQFSSSGRVAGRAPLDLNAFQGTREQLAQLFGYTVKETPKMQNLVLGQAATTLPGESGPRTWVGDGITRRHVKDPDELGGLQYWIKKMGGDPTVHSGWKDLRVLGTDISALLNELSDDEANVISAVRQIVTDDPDATVELTDEQVTQLVDTVVAAVPPAARQGVIEAFARAAENQTPTP